MSQNTTDEFFKTLFLDILQGCSYCFLLKCGNDFIMECVPCFVFLTSSLKKGLVMSIEDAMALYGTYTMWVYFTPVIGDSWRIVTYRWLLC
jgi:POT family proton-dependent oligopeptide transporter